MEDNRLQCILETIIDKIEDSKKEIFEYNDEIFNSGLEIAIEIIKSFLEDKKDYKAIKSNIKEKYIISESSPTIKQIISVKTVEGFDSSKKYVTVIHENTFDYDVFYVDKKYIFDTYEEALVYLQEEM
jgi:nucleoid-associated protein YejK